MDPGLATGDTTGQNHVLPFHTSSLGTFMASLCIRCWTREERGLRDTLPFHAMQSLAVNRHAHRVGSPVSSGQAGNLRDPPGSDNRGFEPEFRGWVGWRQTWTRRDLPDERASVSVGRAGGREGDPIGLKRMEMRWASWAGRARFWAAMGRGVGCSC